MLGGPPRATPGVHCERGALEPPKPACPKPLLAPLRCGGGPLPHPLRQALESGSISACRRGRMVARLLATRQPPRCSLAPLGWGDAADEMKPRRRTETVAGKGGGRLGPPACCRPSNSLPLPHRTEGLLCCCYCTFVKRASNLMQMVPCSLGPSRSIRNTSNTRRFEI